MKTPAAGSKAGIAAEKGETEKIKSLHTSKRRIHIMNQKKSMAEGVAYRYSSTYRAYLAYRTKEAKDKDVPIPETFDDGEHGEQKVYKIRNIHGHGSDKAMYVDLYWRMKFFENPKKDSFEKLATDRGFVCVEVDEEDTEVLEKFECSWMWFGLNYELIEGSFENGESDYNGRLAMLFPYCSREPISIPGTNRYERKIIGKKSETEEDMKEAAEWTEKIAQIAKKHGLNEIIVCMPSYFKANAFRLSLQNGCNVPHDLIRTEARDTGETKDCGEAKPLDLGEVCSRFIGHRTGSAAIGLVSHLKGNGTIFMPFAGYDEKGRALDFFLEPKDETNHFEESE